MYGRYVIDGVTPVISLDSNYVPPAKTYTTHHVAVNGSRLSQLGVENIQFVGKIRNNIYTESESIHTLPIERLV